MLYIIYKYVINIINIFYLHILYNKYNIYNKYKYNNVNHINKNTNNKIIINNNNTLKLFLALKTKKEHHTPKMASLRLRPRVRKPRLTT